MTGFFTGGGATLSFGDTRDPSSFPQFGNRWRGGQIVDIGQVMPQTNMTTKEVIVRNGKTMEQLPVTLLCDGSGPAAEAGLRTDERNPNDHSDTGRRVTYVKGTLRFALGDALRAVQAEDIELGAYLFMMWTGMGKSGNSDFIGRTWQVHYIKPTGVFLNSVSHGAPGFQNQAPPAGPQGPMPVQPNAQGQYAPQHTGFQQAAPPAAPNPYAAPAGVQQHYAPTQQPGGFSQQAYGQQVTSGVAQPNGYQQAPPPAQQFPPVPDQHYVPSPEAPPAGANPWGSAQETPQGPPAPYGPPQGAPAPPAAGNPWQQ